MKKRIIVWILASSNRTNYYLQWTDPYSGRRRSKSAGTSDLQQAEQRKIELEYQLNNEQFSEPGDVDITKLLEVVQTHTPGTGCVYFVREQPAGNVKIGFAKHVSKRLSTLQVSSSRNLLLLGVIPGSVQLEQAIHGCFSGSKIRGEWFRYTSSLGNFIRKHALEYDPQLHDPIPVPRFFDATNTLFVPSVLRQSKPLEQEENDDK